MGFAQRTFGALGWVWRRICDIGTVAWLWPGGATALTVWLGSMQDLPLALLFVLALGAFVLALIAVILWQGHYADAPGKPQLKSQVQYVQRPVLDVLKRSLSPIELQTSSGLAAKQEAAELDPGQTKDLALEELIHRRSLSIGLGFLRGLRGLQGPPPIPQRDTPLKDALAYCLTGAWDVPLESVYTNQTEVDNFNYRLRELTKEFENDRLTVWGRERVMDAFPMDDWQLIEPSFWKKNKILWTGFFSGSPVRTESRNGLGNDDQYQDLMVCRAEIEERWPSG